jgi:Sulfotransferase family
VAVDSYVLIVGCPRSETNLLQRIVDAHPDIAVVFETHSIPRRLQKRRGDYNLEYLHESYGSATEHMRRIYNDLDQLHKLKSGRDKKRFRHGPRSYPVGYRRDVR